MPFRTPLRLLLTAALALACCTAPAAAAKRALFDNFHFETAGNADWTIDDNQPTPSPAQGAIVPSTPRTYWLGAISSWGVDLVKRGFTVTINNAAITYGNAANPLDLSNFDVFIVPEPNNLFTAAEATAIKNFVRDGGGLIAVGDHDVSDRNGDGIDSPKSWNALDPTFEFGVHWGTAGDANNNIVQTSSNVRAVASDSLTRGPEGNVTALAFHNGTTFTLHPEVNPTVRGEVWMTGLPQTSTTGVMAASAQYGSGRVFFCGDSSPIDDGSAQPGNNNIFDGWAEVADSVLFLNATLWATRRAAPVGDLVAPTVTLTSPNGGEDWKAGSSHAITWTASDNVGVTAVDLAWSADGGTTFPNAIASNLANSGTFNWTVPDVPGNNVRVRATARDAATNSSADASNASFTISRWLVTASAGSGGSVSPNGTTSIAQGGSVTITITPAAHFLISSVVVDGVSAGTPTSVSFTNITANHTVVASFAGEQFQLTTGTVGGGVIYKSPFSPTGFYGFGSNVQLTAASAPGWSFTGWSGDASGSVNPTSVLIDTNRTATATFADVQAPSASVTAPVGGESWEVNSTHAITWSASDNAAVDSVTVEWSAHGDAGPWQVIAHGLANSGSLDWLVPASPTDSALVRVTAYDPAGHSTPAMSAALFNVFQNVGVPSGPAVLALARPMPNPARGHATLHFSLPAAHVEDLEPGQTRGRRVWQRTEALPAGASAFSFDG
ncbi:MAG: Ig-like domain-containing protein, partial [Candidatus Eisenbacteria bacterium]